VVRVTALEHNGASLGSGVLVAVTPTHGLVITNWHVVRDATGQILVSFPDGFTSGALVLRTDNTWDLAALAIWRPRAQPLPLSTEPPRPGDPLTIAGYGFDSYRAIAGRCTNYFSPGGGNPREIVELDVAARQGDSGGPILNARGEVAGILFGSNDSFLTGHYTMGSYCGRVRLFVASVGADMQRLPGGAMMAQQSPRSAEPAPAVAIASSDPLPQRYCETKPAAVPVPSSPPPRAPTAGLPQSPPPLPVTTGVASWPATQPQAGIARPTRQPLAEAAAAPPSRAEQIKTVLAAIGAFAVLFLVIRLVAAAAK
jgi:hypothetical protein